MTKKFNLIEWFETHSIEEIRAAIKGGADPVTPIGGKAPVYWLIEMYTRSPRFAECLRVMLDAGAKLDDPLLETVLLDDSGRLREIVASRRIDLEKKMYLGCAYTFLQGVSALHVCAEYNSIECARVLLEAGVDVDVRAEIDSNGLGGQTPLFHTVNSNRNFCRRMMELLADAGAKLHIQLKGLIWGAECDWETILFDINPISYAQCGLLPQFHRREEDVYANIDFLYNSRYGSAMPVRNVPNKYVGKEFNLGKARSGQDPEQLP